MVEGHGKHQVDAGLQEAVDTSKVPDFTLTAAEQWANSAAGSFRTMTAIYADT